MSGSRRRVEVLVAAVERRQLALELVARRQRLRQQHGAERHGYQRAVDIARQQAEVAPAQVHHLPTDHWST